MALHAADRHAEAEEACRTALELAPQRLGTRGVLSLTVLAQNRGDEALAEAAAEPDEAFRLYALAIIHHALGHRAEADDALRQLVQTYAESSAYQIAEACGMRVEVDAAFAWLERAYAQRDGGFIEMMASPRLRALHRDPRWSAFLKKMGFES